MATALSSALIGAILLASPAFAEPGVVVRVLDGDTADIRVAGVVQRVRVAFIDSPEVHACAPGKPVSGGCAKCPAEVELGLRAKAAAVELLPAGSTVDVRPTGKREKYGRTLATITLNDGRDFGIVMLERGLARPYNGRGGKPDWCKGE